MRDIRLECGYSAKELVDLLGYVSVFMIISGLGALNITKTSSTVTVVERDGLGRSEQSAYELASPATAPVRRLGLVDDGMGERHLADLTRKARLLGRPVPKGRPEAVRRNRHVHPA